MTTTIEGLQTDGVRLRVRLHEESFESPTLTVIGDVLAGLTSIAMLNGYGDPGPDYRGLQGSFGRLSPETRAMIRNMPAAQPYPLEAQHSVEMRRALDKLRAQGRDDINMRWFVGGLQRYLYSEPHLELVSVTRNSPYEIVALVLAAAGATTATATIVANRMRTISKRYNEIRADLAKTDVIVARSEAQVAAYSAMTEMLLANQAASLAGAEVADPSQVQLDRSIAALTAIDKLSVEGDLTS